MLMMTRHRSAGEYREREKILDWGRACSTFHIVAQYMTARNLLSSAARRRREWVSRVERSVGEQG